MSNTLFLGNLPTEPDLKKLDEVFPREKLTTDWECSYAEMETILNCAKGTSRFKTITSAWRKRVERAYGIIIGCLAGEGFYILNSKQKLNLSDAKLRSAGRCARRSIAVSALVDVAELDETDKHRLDFQTKRASAILGTLAIKRKQELPNL